MTFFFDQPNSPFNLARRILFICIKYAARNVFRSPGDTRMAVPDGEICMFVGYSGDIASTFKSDEMSGHLVHTVRREIRGPLGSLTYAAYSRRATRFASAPESRVSRHYTCRPQRNNQANNSITSEHRGLQSCLPRVRRTVPRN